MWWWWLYVVGGGGCVWWWWLYVVVVCGGGCGGCVWWWYIFIYNIPIALMQLALCGGFVLGIYSTDTVFACMVMLMHIICTAWVTEVV